jgi:hypothetical protein
MGQPVIPEAEAIVFNERRYVLTLRRGLGVVGWAANSVVLFGAVADSTRKNGWSFFNRPSVWTTSVLTSRHALRSSREWKATRTST